MADKHPYISGSGAVVQLLDQLRKSFPTILTADVLKKLSIAPSNESYAINIVRFLGLIDEAGNRTPEALKLFTLHEDKAFQESFGKLIQTAYHELFALHGDAAWKLTSDQLIPFFRQTDQSSALVGSRQTTTFRTLASYAGHGDLQTPTTPRSSRMPIKKANKSTKPVAPNVSAQDNGGGTGTQGRAGSDMALTVRIEVNLPAAGDQETYDRIFRSIKENLLNG